MNSGRLSSRQAQIIAERARGRTSAETAELLHLSTHTVKTHLRRATARMGATSTTHLIALAIAYREIPAGTACGTEVRR